MNATTISRAAANKPQRHWIVAACGLTLGLGALATVTVRAPGASFPVARAPQTSAPAAAASTLPGPTPHLVYYLVSSAQEAARLDAIDPSERSARINAHSLVVSPSEEIALQEQVEQWLQAGTSFEI